MRGCRCTGMRLCDQCAALAQRAGVLATAEGPAVSEKAFMQAICKIAAAHGWEVFHCHDSRKSAGPGFPDLVLARPPGPSTTGREPGTVLFAELKVAAPLTLQQEHWLDVLRLVTTSEVYVWKPEQMPAIIRRLTR